jgi:hypothetical protein
MRLVSREYKVMLDHGPFADRPAALGALRADLGGIAEGLGGVATRGRFERERERTIAFLDTPDLALRRAEFVLRRRMAKGKAEYTLKCRSEDRYFAAGADLRSVEGFEPDEKLEEDIAPPFRPRFSHSNTVRPPKGSRLRRGEPPGTLGEAAAFFPVLGMSDDGVVAPNATLLRIVNGVVAFERVFTGMKLDFGGRGRGDDEASVALILWTDGDAGPPLVAEFSFRLEDRKERFSRGLSRRARSFFEAVQRIDRARPEGTTKTEFIYRDTDGD